MEIAGVMDDWRAAARPQSSYAYRKAKRLLKRGARYLPVDLEMELMEQGIDTQALKSKYQG